MKRCNVLGDIALDGFIMEMGFDVQKLGFRLATNERPSGGNAYSQSLDPYGVVECKGITSRRINVWEKKHA